MLKYLFLLKNLVKMNITQDKIKEFLTKSASLSQSSLEKEAGLSQGLINKVLAGKRDFNKSHIAKLYPVLKKYGYSDMVVKKAKVISLLNHKGGVGKTTSTMNLGKALGLLGYKTLAVDLDPQCNLTQWYDVLREEDTIYEVLLNNQDIKEVEVDDHLHVVPSNLKLSQAESELHQKINGYSRLRSALKSKVEEYDYILVDCPPSLNILTASALIASDSVIIIMQPEKLPMNGLVAIIDAINQVNEESEFFLNIEGLLYTQVKKNLVNHQETMQHVNDICSSNDINVFDTVIRNNTALSECVWLNQDIFTYDKNSIGAEDYMNFAKELINE